MAASGPAAAAAANVFDEDAVIKSRLFSAEERVYKRIQKRCSSFLPADMQLEAASSAKTTAATPTTTETSAASTATIDYGKLRQEIDMDFASFEASIERVQLLTDANRKEIARYEESKHSITQAALKAKDDMEGFHEDLRVAQEDKANRLVYDQLAREILSQSHLKSRTTQGENILRLEKEIRDLERERNDYGKVWAARRKQFDEIVAALTAMQMQIQEDKEEQERREALDDEGSEGEEVEAAHGKKESAMAADKGLLAAQGVSGATTPAIVPDAGGGTPKPLPAVSVTTPGAGATAGAAAAEEDVGNTDTAMEDVRPEGGEEEGEEGEEEEGEEREHFEDDDSREEGQEDESMRNGSEDNEILDDPRSHSRSRSRSHSRHSRSRSPARDSASNSVRSRSPHSPRSRSRSRSQSHSRSRSRSRSHSHHGDQYSEDDGEVSETRSRSKGYTSPGSRSRSRTHDDDDEDIEVGSKGSVDASYDKLKRELDDEHSEGEAVDHGGEEEIYDEGEEADRSFVDSVASSVPPEDSHHAAGADTPQQVDTPVDTMDTT